MEVDMGIVRWYWEMTKGQRILCWFVSLPCWLVYGIGFFMMAILLYGHMGKEKYLAELAEKSSTTTPF